MRPALLAAAFAIVAITWAATTPPLGYPDEANHYVRALAVGSGDLHGRANPQVSAPGFTDPIEKVCCEPGTANTVHWAALGVRIVTIPADLVPERMPCPPAGGVPPAPCDAPPSATQQEDRLTTMGTVEPALYVLPGLAANLASTPPLALRLGRFANALLCAGLLTSAVFALRDPEGSPLAFVGLAVAVTPMVTFISGSISPSAVEISGGIAFFALLLRAVRDHQVRRAIWAQLTIAGSALALSRSLGPVWIALDIAVVAAFVGLRHGLDRIRTSGRTSAAATAVVLVAGLTTVAWERLYQPGIGFDFHFFLTRIRPSVADLPRIGEELIGVFGFLNIRMSSLEYLAWQVMLLVLVAAALAVGTSRDRLVLIALVSMNVAVPVFVSAALLNQNGFGLQGRHVLAFAVTVPLLAGEIVYKQRERIAFAARAALVLTVTVGAVFSYALAFRAAGDAYGWLHTNARGGAFPPGGRDVWIAALAIATTCFLAAFVSPTAIEWKSRRYSDRSPG